MLLNYIKRGAYNTFFYWIASIVVRLVTFFFLPFFLSKLTIEEFGIWDFYQTFFSIGVLILSTCAANSLIRFFLLYKNEPEKQKQAVGNALLTVLLSSLSFPLLFLPVIKYFHPALFGTSYLVLSIFNISLFSLFSLTIAYLRITEQLTSYLMIFCGQSLLTTGLTVLGIAYDYGINSFFYANLTSYIVFLPVFFLLLIKSRSYSLPIFKEQLKYSLPLFAYGLIYALFANVDRFFIKEYYGYETLGSYSLLWRFGTIFQFFSIAMYDAWPIVLYNAQKEENGDNLISKLIIYYCIILTTGCLGAIVTSKFGIFWFFPKKYFYLIEYLPFFFLSISGMEISKVLRSGFGLSTKTLFVPIITAIMLGFQVLLFMGFNGWHLWGFLAANTISFSIYAFISYLGSKKVYSPHIFNNRKLIKIILLFISYTTLFHFLITTNMSMIIGVLATWPFAIWFSVIDEKEKKLIFVRTQTVVNQLAFKKKRVTHLPSIKTTFHTLDSSTKNKQKNV